MDDSGFQVTGELTPPVGERCSLDLLRSVVRGRAGEAKSSGSSRGSTPGREPAMICSGLAFKRKSP